MTLNREQIINRLHEKSGFYKKDIKKLLQYFDDVVIEAFGEVDADNDVVVQLIEGIKLRGTLVPVRERVDPRTQKPIVVKETVKPSVKYSNIFRTKIQKKYEENNDD